MFKPHFASHAAGLSVFMLTACFSPPTSSGSTGNGLLGHLGITDAKSLLLAGEPSNSYRIASGNDMKRLYKVDSEGHVKPVEARYDGGAPMSHQWLTFNYLENVNSQFVIASVQGFGGPGGVYLIRRSDGKAARIYDRPYFPYPMTGSFSDGTQAAQADDLGRIHFNADGTLIRLIPPSDDSATQVAKTEINRSDLERIQSYAVDRQGNALAWVTGSTSRIRLYKANGGFQNLATLNSGGAVWRNQKSDLFYGGYGEGIHRVSLQADGTATSSLLIDISGHSNTYVSSRAELSDQTIFLGHSGPPATSENPQPVSKPQLFFIQGDGVRKVELTRFPKAKQIKASESHVFLLEENRIGRFDLATETEQDFFSDPNFQLMTFEVTPDDRVTISALRLSDNTYVVGELNTEGKLSVLTTEIPPVQQLLTLQ